MPSFNYRQVNYKYNYNRAIKEIFPFKACSISYFSKQNHKDNGYYKFISPKQDFSVGCCCTIAYFTLGNVSLLSKYHSMDNSDWFTQWQEISTVLSLQTNFVL